MGGGNYSERRVLFCWAAAAGGWRNKRSSDCWIAGLKLNYRNVESCWILLVTTATPGKSLESDWDVKRMMFAAAGMTEKWERSDRDRRLFLFEHEWMREQKSFLFWMNPNQSLSRANKTTVGRLHTRRSDGLISSCRAWITWPALRVVEVFTTTCRLQHVCRNTVSLCWSTTLIFQWVGTPPWKPLYFLFCLKQ